jgi:hypothetical protein
MLTSYCALMLLTVSDAEICKRSPVWSWRVGESGIAEELNGVYDERCLEDLIKYDFEHSRARYSISSSTADKVLQTVTRHEGGQSYPIAAFGFAWDNSEKTGKWLEEESRQVQDRHGAAGIARWALAVRKALHSKNPVWFTLDRYNSNLEEYRHSNSRELRNTLVIERELLVAFIAYLKKVEVKDIDLSAFAIRNLENEDNPSVTYSLMLLIFDEGKRDALSTLFEKYGQRNILESNIYKFKPLIWPNAPSIEGISPYKELVERNRWNLERKLKNLLGLAPPMLPRGLRIPIEYNNPEYRDACTSY